MTLFHFCPIQSLLTCKKSLLEMFSYHKINVWTKSKVNVNIDLLDL